MKIEAGNFWERVSKGDGCWEWQGALRANGYGQLNIRLDGKRRNVTAHRFAYFLTTGTWPPLGTVVMHSCENRACVRPEHLSAGSQSENLKFAARNGGWGYKFPRGNKLGKALRGRTK